MFQLVTSGWGVFCSMVRWLYTRMRRKGLEIFKDLVVFGCLNLIIFLRSIDIILVINKSFQAHLLFLTQTKTYLLTVSLSTFNHFN